MKPRFQTIFALGAALLLAAATGCFRNERRTIVLQVPQLNGKECADLIRDRLLGHNEESSGRVLTFYHTVEADLARRTVTVVYQSTVIAGMNVIQTVADLGFDVSDAADPARARAGSAEARQKLPAGCR